MGLLILNTFVSMVVLFVAWEVYQRALELGERLELKRKEEEEEKVSE